MDGGELEELLVEENERHDTYYSKRWKDVENFLERSQQVGVYSACWVNRIVVFQCGLGVDRSPFSGKFCNPDPLS